MQDLSLQYYHSVLHLHDLGLTANEICNQLDLTAEHICRTLTNSLYLGLPQQNLIKTLLDQPLTHSSPFYVKESPCINLVNSFYNDRNPYEPGWRLAWLRLIQRYLQAQLKRNDTDIFPKRRSEPRVFPTVDLKLQGLLDGVWPRTGEYVKASLQRRRNRSDTNLYGN